MSVTFAVVAAALQHHGVELHAVLDQHEVPLLAVADVARVHARPAELIWWRRASLKHNVLWGGKRGTIRLPATLLLWFLKRQHILIRNGRECVCALNLSFKFYCSFLNLLAKLLPNRPVHPTLGISFVLLFPIKIFFKFVYRFILFISFTSLILLFLISFVLLVKMFLFRFSIVFLVVLSPCCSLNRTLNLHV